MAARHDNDDEDPDLDLKQNYLQQIDEEGEGEDDRTAYRTNMIRSQPIESLDNGDVPADEWEPKQDHLQNQCDQNCPERQSHHKSHGHMHISHTRQGS